jgi:hypothetical protein
MNSNPELDRLAAEVCVSPSSMSVLRLFAEQDSSSSPAGFPPATPSMDICQPQNKDRGMPNFLSPVPSSWPAPEAGRLATAHFGKWHRPQRRCPAIRLRF